MDLNGRVALVTGAARRVGRAISLRLARAGCAVAAHYGASRSDAESLVAECRAAGVDAEAFAADFSDASAPSALVRAVLTRFGRLDALINNASTFEEMHLDDFELAKWERTLRINLSAPMALAYEARDELRRRGGRILNLCDVAAARGWPSHLAYATSKAGLAALTASLARAFAPEVNVVGIAPGVAAWPDDYPAEKRERITRRIPLGRSGSPEDIAAMALFLLREGDYITGAVLPVDGGRSTG